LTPFLPNREALSWKNPYFNGGSIPGFHVLQGIAVTSDVGPLAIP